MTSQLIGLELGPDGFAIILEREDGETVKMTSGEVMEFAAAAAAMAILLAHDALGWAEQNAIEIDTRYRQWRAQHVCSLIDRKQSAATIKAVIEHSDQFSAHQRNLGHSAHLKRCAQGLHAAVTYTMEHIDQ